MYQRFAVIGVGAVGLAVSKALLERNAFVLIITRPGSSTPTSSFPANANLAAVDITDVTALASVLRANDTEVVISAIGIAGLSTQHIQGDAAKAAGVKLFVPSEFGFPSIGREGHTLQLKDRFAVYLRSIGLPSARLFNGGLMEWIPFLVLLDKTGKFHITKGSDKGVSWTATADVAGFLAHVLVSFPPSELADSIFRIEGEHASLDDIAAMYGDKVEIVQDTFAGDAFRTYMFAEIEKGMGSTGWDFATGKDLGPGSSNVLWAGHKWKGIKEILNL
jgi:hypothetical protein